MKLSDLQAVNELGRQLKSADRILDEFRAAPGPNVRATAQCEGGIEVDLLPIPKDVAVSAAERARAKVVERLRQLGVEPS